MRKIILITGTSSGIGKETAMTLAKQGHQLIIHGRNPEKSKAVYEEIIQESGNKNIDLYTADLSLMSEVRAFSDKIRKKYDHIDVLINNAGGQFGSEREVTAEGHEKTFAINTLAPFLLTHLLLPLLRKSQSGRVVTVSSESYKTGGEVDWNDVEFEKKYSLIRSYGLSKRYALWIMNEFSEKLKAENIHNVTINSLEPGSTPSGLQRVSGEGTIMKIIMFLWKPLTNSMEEAAATSIYLATSNEVEGKTGGFYGKMKEKNIPQRFTSKEDQKKIWEYCLRISKPYMD